MEEDGELEKQERRGKEKTRQKIQIVSRLQVNIKLKNVFQKISQTSTASIITKFTELVGADDTSLLQRLHYHKYKGYLKVILS